MQTYRFFGITFANDYPFTCALLPGDAAPSFNVACLDNSPITTAWMGTEPLYVSRYHNEAGTRGWQFYRTADYGVMRCADITVLYRWRDFIVCQCLSGREQLKSPEGNKYLKVQDADACAIEVNFLAAALAHRLGGLGVPVWRASAAAPGG